MPTPFLVLHDFGTAMLMSGTSIRIGGLTAGDGNCHCCDDKGACVCPDDRAATYTLAGTITIREYSDASCTTLTDTFTYNFSDTVTDEGACVWSFADGGTIGSNGATTFWIVEFVYIKLNTTQCKWIVEAAIHNTFPDVEWVKGISTLGSGDARDYLPPTAAGNAYADALGDCDSESGTILGVPFGPVYFQIDLTGVTVT